MCLIQAIKGLGHVARLLCAASSPLVPDGWISDFCFLVATASDDAKDRAQIMPLSSKKIWFFFSICLFYYWTVSH